MSKTVSFMPDAWDDYVYWQETDRKTLNRLNRLLKDILRNSYEGLGKPEQLRGDLAGYWSRRIDDTNRIVYKVDENTVIVYACRSHYSDR